MTQPDLFPAPAPQPLHRLFFALWPDDALRAQAAGVAAELRRRHGNDGRLLNPRRYHLTLRFLGDFPGELPASALAGARAAGDAVRAPAFELVLDRAGSFGRNRSIPWWLGCAPDHAALQALWRRLGEALAQRRLRDASGHRTLAPHLTVVRDARRALPETPIVPLHWRVDRFVLVHSELGQRNAYTLLGEWPLG
ncbi:RNA 2',3'-cyclic phosphodiesterase [Vulcaniibacterium tengchongense]|uniref:RNA 2',3'-cyclic phosphodiesterase n=1 Tax=Vulcaniibacterium tengchongense TaxID=1273429 RepID=A0A3N4VKB9_9GAMM|nr:RNA 2',3'-cyclic phosphodiesterase [Vulcaniibacterium tengchongense]RPE81885.1 2'-5' RNA ligase [Vulcaniibacterium tengchongense]